MTQDFELKKIKMIVGLGNAEQEYIYTRHNAGFLFLDYIAQSVYINLKKFQCYISEIKIENSKIMLIKPTTMMNNSGDCVGAVKTFYKFNNDEILVIYDDLDLKLGEYKLQFQKRPKVHNGVTSVVEKVGSDDFWSLRIGIENRDSELKKNISGADYVLGRFKQDELKELKDTFERIVTEIIPQ